MLDIIDVRRNQVMIQGEFPSQLQTAFRGMERAKNPWGINHDKRLDWAHGLDVQTTDENPDPDVLFWVGCAASYDPQSQKTARAFVQLLDHAGVDFAVLGKRECCTGDTARRAGNEYLYRQLAEQNIATLNEVKPKLIVASCPHCMNTVGKEYAQLGGDYKVMHHTEYLEILVAEGKIKADTGSSTVTYHDPCYLGRHNGVYDAPRNLLHVISNSVVELDRNRENSFCCGAGGAQFWKEEEAGRERISDHRYREVQQRLQGAEDKVLAVGCPFCKSMLESTPGKGEGADTIVVKDVAELLLEGVQRRSGLKRPLIPEGSSEAFAMPAIRAAPAPVAASWEEPAVQPGKSAPQPAAERTEERKKWSPKATPATRPQGIPEERTALVANDQEPKRKAWAPKRTSSAESQDAPIPVDASESVVPEPAVIVVRKTWAPKTIANPNALPPKTSSLSEDKS